MNSLFFILIRRISTTIKCGTNILLNYVCILPFLCHYILYPYIPTDVSSQPTTVTVGRTSDPATTITATPTIGQSVELQCTRTSAVKRWSNTGSEVSPTENEISTTSGPTRILAFSSFTPSHAGTYSCEVWNNNNIDTTTYPVILATG